MKDSDDVVMWVQLPKPMSVKELDKLGIGGAACYGGDTCIAATAPTAKAGIVIEKAASRIYRQARLQPQAACFGGDTCIV